MKLESLKSEKFEQLEKVQMAKIQGGGMEPTQSRYKDSSGWHPCPDRTDGHCLEYFVKGTWI